MKHNCSCENRRNSSDISFGKQMSLEPIVYITQTGRKYHTYTCKFLQEHNIENKFAIYLDGAEKNYNPCGVCYQYRTEKLR